MDYGFNRETKEKYEYTPSAASGWIDLTLPQPRGYYANDEIFTNDEINVSESSSDE